jgi:hypothetical protein
MTLKISKVCFPCGVYANILTCLKTYGRRPNQLAFTVSTYHKGTCDICEEETDVTEPRDFFYPDFSLLETVTNYISNTKLIELNQTYRELIEQAMAGGSVKGVFAAYQELNHHIESLRV